MIRTHQTGRHIMHDVHSSCADTKDRLTGAEALIKETLADLEDGDAGRKIQRAQEELRASEDRYKRLFSSLQEGFSLHEVIFDDTQIDYLFLDVNPAFERHVGQDRDNLIGKTIKQIFPDLEGHWFDALDRVAITGESATLEYVSPASGRYFEVHVYRPDKGQIAILYSDVSERRKLLVEQEKNDRLESLGVLAGGIAHDFNNILTVIFGNISLALKMIGRDHEASARLAESEKALFKATGLTRQLLTFARGGEPVKKLADAHGLILDAVQFILHGSNCKANLSLSPGLWFMEVDADQIQQVLNNLIINAAQSMPDGGEITFSAVNETIAISDDGSLAPGMYVKISVADRGGGIPAQILPKIFDPYFTTKPTGSGLGLASAFSIVKRHNGAIRVSSTSRAGTTFEVHLPATDKDGIVDADAPMQLLPATRGKSILVMDDEEMIRAMAEEMLAELGYSVAICPDGNEAVRLYRSYYERGEPFAAVILDMTVPGGMGGKEAAEHIRNFDQDAVIIISSGYAADHLLGGDMVQGMVPKPYNLHVMAQELSRVLSEKEMRTLQVRANLQLPLCF